MAVILPFALPLGLYVAAFGLGWPIARTRLLPLPREARLLASAPIGLAIFYLFLPAFAQFGQPLDRYELPILAVLGAWSITGLTIVLAKREFWPTDAWAVALIALSFVSFAYPLLLQGFSWLAFENADMSEREIYSQALAHFGFHRSEYGLGTLAKYPYAGFDTYGFIASGTASLLAIVSMLARETPVEIGMGTLAFGFIVLLSATYAMTRSVASAAPARVAVVLLASSAVTRWGVLIQHIDQVMGLSFLSGSLIFVRPSKNLRRQILSAVGYAGCCAALLNCYPHMGPFLLAAPGAVLILISVRHRNRLRSELLKYCLSAGCIVFLGFNRNVVNGVSIVWDVLRNKQGYLGLELGGTLLTPDAFPTLWGILPSFTIVDDPFESIAIAAGILLLLVAAVMLWPRCARVEPPALLAALTLTAMLLFIAKRNEYGVYKCEMYVQPALLSAIAITAWNGWRRLTGALKVLPAAVLFVLFAGGLRTDWLYQVRSIDAAADWAGSFTQIRHASSRSLVSDLQRLKTSGESPVLSDTLNRTVAHYEIVELAGRPMTFLSSDFYPPSTRGVTPIARFDEASDHLPTRVEFRPFFSELALRRRHGVLINIPSLVVWNQNESRGHYLASPQLTELRNYLVAIDSTVGHVADYNGPDASIYNVERDFARAALFQAFGRYNLFQIIAPSETIRVRLCITNSVFRGRDASLPEVRVLGDIIVPMRLSGSGSACVTSRTFKPRVIDGLAYILLDLGRSGSHFDKPRHGLMGLFATDIGLDARSITTFVRQLEVIPGSSANQAPTALTRSMLLLLPPKVEESGFFEDGWLSERPTFKLRNPMTATLAVSFTIPEISGEHVEREVTVIADGHEVETIRLRPGINVLHTAKAFEPGIHEFTLIFSSTQLLPNGDGRHVAAFMGYATLIPKPHIADPGIAREVRRAAHA